MREQWDKRRAERRIRADEYDEHGQRRADSDNQGGEEEKDRRHRATLRTTWHADHDSRAYLAARRRPVFFLIFVRIGHPQIG
jgi:hypothetical protein